MLLGGGGVLRRRGLIKWTNFVQLFSDDFGSFPHPSMNASLIECLNVQSDSCPGWKGFLTQAGPICALSNIGSRYPDPELENQG